MPAHPTGRVVGERDPYQLDLGAVFDACLANRVAVEHNASERFDLSDVDLMAAREKGLTVSIGSDAHSVQQLGLLAYGVDQLRRAWLTPAGVLNAWKIDDVKRFLRKERAGDY